MRDPNRLYKFYEELRNIHMAQAPDWRFSQFISNVFCGIDTFYMEEEDVMKHIRKYFHMEEK